MKTFYVIHYFPKVGSHSVMIAHHTKELEQLTKSLEKSGAKIIKTEKWRGTKIIKTEKRS